MPFRSLRARLVFWTIAPLSIIAALDVALSYRNAFDLARVGQEAQLFGSARIIAEQITYNDGALSVSIPPAALELFDPALGGGQRDQVFYRVSGPDGRLLSGYFEMAVPGQAVAPESRIFFDTVMRGAPVHAVAYAAPVPASPLSAPALIVVGQTVNARDALARDLWRKSAMDHLLILAAATVLIIVALRFAMSSIISLRDQVMERRPGALEPLDPAGVPGELQPLVAAVNDYIARLGRHIVEHDRFIADASHQLRTPLTAFSTQVGYALQQKNVQEKDGALRDLRKGLRRMMRLVSQLLAYTESDAQNLGHKPLETVDMSSVIRVVLEDQALLAQEKNIDLGYEAGAPGSLVRGSRHLMNILVSNLVDNAVRYTPPGGAVTVRLDGTPDGGLLLTVADNGPGIAATERERVFDRFYRLHGEDQPGCGLGLAIVREIARNFDIEVTLGEPPGGTGTLASVRFPPRNAPPATAGDRPSTLA